MVGKKIDSIRGLLLCYACPAARMAPWVAALPRCVLPNSVLKRGNIRPTPGSSVAIARAVANRPRLVLADEPTGNLDRVNARESLKLIRETCAENGAALLMVSHDPAVLSQFETTIELAKINRATSLMEERA